MRQGVSRRVLACVCSLGLVVAFGASATVARAEQMENPAYKQWAKFKPGSSAKWRQESEAAGNKSKMEMTTTLVDVSPDKATIETKTSMEVGGNKMDLPGQKTDVPAKVEKGTAVAAPDAPKPDTKESDEEVEIGGKKYKCHVVESTMKIGDNTTKSKVWTSDEVPGSMVKMESSTEGQMKMMTKMELVEVMSK